MSVPEAVVIDPVDFAQINCLTKEAGSIRQVLLHAYDP